MIIGNVFGSNSCISDCRWRSRWVNLNPFNQKRILLLDPPRDEVIATYQAADLFVFASNIEYSPLVLFEAMGLHARCLSAQLAAMRKKSLSGVVLAVLWKQGRYLMVV